MEIEGQDGTKIKLRHDTKTVCGRGSGFNTKDRTVSRCHVIFQLETPPDKTENQTEPRVSFEVIGKNPLWLRTNEDGKTVVKVFRNSEKGAVAAGDWFCVSSLSPVWLKLKRTEVAEERSLESGEGGEIDVSLDTFDVSQIDPVKEFGFLVIGHEFDCYPKQRMRDIRDWNWFLDEPARDSEDDDDDDDDDDDGCGGSESTKTKKKRNGGRTKRKKGGVNGDNEDEDWTDENNEVVAKMRKVERSKYLTRSKDPKKPNKKNDLKQKTIRSNDEDDDTLGGFIVKEDDEVEEEEDEEEEEEFIDDDDDDDD